MRRQFAAAGALLVILLVPGCATAPVEPATSVAAQAVPTSSVAIPAPSKALGPSRPSTLEVPAIGVRTQRLVDLGLTPDRELEVPRDAVTTGWFTEGPTPGEAGPAVIAAHVDYKHVPGVFSRLKELHPGEQAIVHRDDGTTAVFDIYRVEHYPKASFPTDDVYGDTTGPELRLITCGGVFDHSTGNYLDNIVVYARLNT
ncbi:class F sortase [Amycolatopsis sp. H20-H5]|uniref:class F sortase n=1 Tax=Amycolatopsis sp. H20-H5 TaxID=3046309 RepID=UPI002DB9CF6E|nr:class F sortase [Amycolatopsis sp. H20-H5]MEC3977952.1 class F sortase [Amycolatopsis sp. H20-H5]